VTCRYDRDAKAHLLREHRADCTSRTCKGCLRCTHDDGNPVRHCRTRLRCTSHLEWDEHTCPTCLGKIRGNLTAILDALALMPDEALERGVDSEPANLAGPHADYVTAQWRLVNASRAGQPVEELDMRDPYTCLTLHERTIREELGHDETTLVSADVAAAVSYLDWVLTDLARDEDRTPMLTALQADAARLRAHVEAALRDARTPERGAPCPECTRAGRAAERLERRYGHWCTKAGCEREHVRDASADVWVCPVDTDHEWTHERYENYVERRRSA
jgi:hypothetical protein